MRDPIESGSGFDPKTSEFLKEGIESGGSDFLKISTKGADKAKQILREKHSQENPGNAANNDEGLLYELSKSFTCHRCDSGSVEFLCPESTYVDAELLVRCGIISRPENVTTNQLAATICSSCGHISTHFTD